MSKKQKKKKQNKTKQDNYSGFFRPFTFPFIISQKFFLHILSIINRFNSSNINEVKATAAAAAAKITGQKKKWNETGDEKSKKKNKCKTGEKKYRQMPFISNLTVGEAINVYEKVPLKALSNRHRPQQTSSNYFDLGYLYLMTSAFFSS